MGRHRGHGHKRYTFTFRLASALACHYAPPCIAIFLHVDVLCLILLLLAALYRLTATPVWCHVKPLETWRGREVRDMRMAKIDGEKEYIGKCR